VAGIYEASSRFRRSDNRRRGESRWRSRPARGRCLLAARCPRDRGAGPFDDQRPEPRSAGMLHRGSRVQSCGHATARSFPRMVRSSARNRGRPCDAAWTALVRVWFSKYHARIRTPQNALQDVRALAARHPRVLSHARLPGPRAPATPRPSRFRPSNCRPQDRLTTTTGVRRDACQRPVPTFPTAAHTEISLDADFAIAAAAQRDPLAFQAHAAA
jgi:hypothetical protein